MKVKKAVSGGGPVLNQNQRHEIAHSQYRFCHGLTKPWQTMPFPWEGFSASTRI